MSLNDLLRALLLLQMSVSDPPVPPETSIALERPVNRIEAFEPLRPPLPGLSEEVDLSYDRLRCSADRLWCASLEQGAQDAPLRLQLCGIESGPHPHAITGCIRHDYLLKSGGAGDPEYEVWPFIVREAGGAVMIGLLTRHRNDSPLRIASSTRLTLLRAEWKAGPLVEVLDVPLSATAMIRACHNLEVSVDRRDPCLVEYAFRGTLSLLSSKYPHGPDGRPRFYFETRASTWPGQVSRLDRSARGRLREKHFLWWIDPDCSYRRIYAHAAAGSYVPNTPLPHCGAWLDPNRAPELD